MNNEKTVTIEVEGKAAEHIHPFRLQRVVPHVVAGAARYWNLFPTQFVTKLTPCKSDDVVVRDGPDAAEDSLRIEVSCKVGRRNLTSGWQIGPISRGMTAQLFQTMRHFVRQVALKLRRVR